MKRATLRLLRCPACMHDELSLEATDAPHSAAEVQSGVLICTACGRRFDVEQGVPVLITALDADTERERAARSGTIYDPDKERRRPFIHDPANPWLWPSFAANVQQGIDLLDGCTGPILDLGAATCWSTRMLAEAGFDALALDVSSTMLHAGGAQYATRVWFERLAGDMMNLPFRSAQFGGILASATIHHAESIEAVFRELRRVLRSDGRAVLVNEPVKGLLTRGETFGAEDIAQGMNEHIFPIWNYVRAARNAGMDFEVLFPDSLARQIRGVNPAPSKLFGWAAAALRPLPCSLRPLLVWPAHTLVGLPLVGVATVSKTGHPRAAHS